MRFLGFASAEDPAPLDEIQPDQELRKQEGSDGKDVGSEIIVAIGYIEKLIHLQRHRHGDAGAAEIPCSQDIVKAQVLYRVL